MNTFCIHLVFLSALQLQICTTLAFVLPSNTYYYSTRLHESKATPPMISGSVARRRNNSTRLHESKAPSQMASGSVARRRNVLEKIEGLFGGSTNTFEKRQKIRQEMEAEEEKDFLLADVKPASLVHERDFFRQATRIEAWDQYVLVSILLTSISYGALQGFQLNSDHEGVFFYETILKTTLQSTAALGVLCGLYSTMVFSLSILYGKEGLGLERDMQYDDFLYKTEDIRHTAFLSFSMSLLLFAITVVLVLAEDLPLAMHFPIGSIMLVALYIGIRDWSVLVSNGREIDDFFVD